MNSSRILCSALVAVALLAAGRIGCAQPTESVWRDYHDYPRMVKELRDLAAKRPDLARLRSIGKSAQGRDLWVITIARPGGAKDRPEALFDGGIHGSEVIGSEAMLAYARYLVERADSDPEARRTVDGWVTHVLPMLNPDGIEASRTAPIGPKARKNARGVDLNRNFDWRWDQGRPESADPGAWEYRGESPFSEPESRALRDFVRSRPLLLYVNGHAGTAARKLITEIDSEDEALFAEAGAEVQKEAGYPRVRGRLSGEAAHWVYWTGMEAVRKAGRRPLSFILEIYTRPEVMIESRDWWDRYQPPADQAPEWIRRVRTVLNCLTRLSSRRLAPTPAP